MAREGQLSDYPRAADVAEALGVTKNTVWTWAKRGILRSYYIEGCLYFCWQDINEVLAKNSYIGKCRRPTPSYRGGRGGREGIDAKQAQQAGLNDLP